MASREKLSFADSSKMGRVELDNNSVERAIRPQTITDPKPAARHGRRSSLCLRLRASMTLTPALGSRTRWSTSPLVGQIKISMRSYPGISPATDGSRWTLTLTHTVPLCGAVSTIT
jgi:hypothetical protein